MVTVLWRCHFLADRRIPTTESTFVHIIYLHIAKIIKTAFPKFKYSFNKSIFIKNPPQMKLEGRGYIGFTHTVSVDMILSMHVLRIGCLDFSENLFMHWLLTIWRGAPRILIMIGYFFFYITGFFFCFWTRSFRTRNTCSVLKLMKNFVLNIEKVLFFK